MPTLLKTFLTGPSPGATHAAGPPVAGHTVSESSFIDCHNSKVASHRSQR